MSDSPPRIKRAAKTYGRPKAARADTSFDADTSFGQASLLSDTSGNLDPSEIADVPPTSDFDASFGSLRDDDDEDEDASPGGGIILNPKLTGYVSIRDRLRMLDEEMDKKESRPDRSGEVRAQADDVPLASSLGNNSPEREAASPAQAAFHDTGLLSSKKPTETLQSSPSPPPIPLASRLRKKHFPATSDIEFGPERDYRSPSPQTSPSKLYHINTPASRSSPTPPTSSEMPSRQTKRKKTERPIPGLDLKQADGDYDDDKPSRTISEKKGKAVEGRVRPPTKKDIQESRKATARLQAQRTVTVPRVQQKQLHLSDLFHRVHRVERPAAHQTQTNQLSSDPIVPFSPASAAPPPHSGPSRRAPVVQISGQSRSNSRALSPDGTAEQSTRSMVSFELPDLSDSEEELPDAKDILRDKMKEHEVAKRRRQLHELKMRALEFQQNNASFMPADDSSDLEVEETMGAVVKEEAEERRKARFLKTKTPVKKRKSQLPEGLLPVQQDAILAAAAKPKFVDDLRPNKNNLGSNAKIRKDELNRLLLQNAEKESQAIIEQKEREWVSRGGKVMPRHNTEERRDDVLKERLADLATKALSTVQPTEASDDGEVEDSEDDGNWEPEEQVHEDGDDMAVSENPFIDQLTEDGVDETEPENTAPRPKRKRRAVTVVASDGEEEYSRPTGRVLVPDSSLVLDADSPPRESSDKENINQDTEIDETDKENDASLMYDRGEDKENTVIASAVLPISRPTFDRSLSSRGSFSSRVGSPSGPSPGRAPLKSLLSGDDEDDPFMSTPIRHIDKKPAASLDFFSPARRMPDVDDDEPGPSNHVGKPSSLGPPANIKVGFSQFGVTQEGENELSPAVAGPSKTQFSQFVTPAKVGNGFERLRQAAKGKDLTLTLTTPLKPSLDVTDSVRKKADNIFGQEQEIMVEKAVQQPDAAPQLYLNEHGFYTQNPAAGRSALDSSPFVADAFSSQKTSMRSSPLLNSVLKPKARAPLGTIDLAVDEDEPQSLRPKRIVRRARTPELGEEGGYRSSPSPSPSRRPHDAFKLLMHQQRRSKIPKPKCRLEKSAFIEGEAEESDEDAMFGFGGPKQKTASDEEDGEDQDGVLQELVDDQAMDTNVLNEEKVLEKVKEHQELDDAELERIHREAVEGKLRAKRRDRGIGFEDSDSDDEDDENARRRRKMAKKRRLDGDDSLDKLAKNKETQAFVESYNAGLPDDDFQDFAHLEHDDESLFLPASKEDNFDESDNEDEEQQPQVVSARELRDELRRAARGETSIQELDPEDVSWVDNDDMDIDDEPIRVKEFTLAKRTPAHRSNTDQLDLIPGVPTMEPSFGLTQQTKWANKARAEGLSGTGRASAITGHAVSSKSKSGRGTIVGRNAGTSASAGRDGKRPAASTKAVSALSRVSSRRDRFAN